MASTENRMDNCSSVPEKNIPEFFAGRDIFVTGGTGFLGKALIEKLLRSCPDIGNIYLLVRSRHGMNPDVRVEEILRDILFDTLREQNPDVVSKLHAVAGDIAQPGLGLSPEDRQLLIERVSVVFHMAASVSFTDPLQKAVITNVRSTRDCLELAKEMKQLKVFLHVSTAYSNTDRVEIEEKLYPVSCDWRTYVQAAETLDSFSLDILSRKILGRHPNTYTFSKSLAEHVVEDYQHLIPVAIVRPSIVMSAHTEPLPGWTDNFNGPFGIITSAAKGITRVIWAGNARMDFIPVDVVIKGIIIATWRKSHDISTSELRVYNAASHDMFRYSVSNIMDLRNRVLHEVPLQSIYYPFFFRTKSYTLFVIGTYFLHMTLAALVDSILYISGKKPILIKVQRRIFAAMTELHLFMSESWTIRNKNFIDLQNYLHPLDQPNFHYKFESIDMKMEIIKCALIVRKTLLRETSTMEENFALYKKQRILHYALCTLGVALLLWMCASYSWHWSLLSLLARITSAVLMV